MQEIEVKILNINSEKVRKKLLELGAKKVFEGEVKASHFDFSDERIRNAGEDLRVRTVGNKVEFCFKGKNQSEVFKSKEEIEVITDSFQKTTAILDRLGLKEQEKFAKRRESYQLGKVKFEIDTYPELPTFLEIEAPTEDEVEKYVKALGYTLEQTTNLTAGELIKNAKNNTT
ncbi:class IV adenylate cyclase [Candidatus Woesearchaeota archaeon CG10_big_fil_rev_8_21_14_0_10_45_16]|nr:MAG: class IV adenylate cyclase [Candidatus Woesearchaeota archaeon CG10_big_fil_rev_8_21_14_0_10_45_16]